MYGRISRMEFIPGVFEVLQPSAPKERMTALEKKCAIRMENITKRFGSKVIANKDVNLELYEGEILSLLGENGSGKTTLMNMLSGIYFPDEGQIYVHDKPVTIASPKDAFDLGIGMIHQHFKLVDLFTATENIILGLEGKLDLNNARQKVKDICDKYGFDIDPDMKIYDMSVSQKQTVEIVKVLYRGADILILDEPTNHLDIETDAYMVKSMKRQYPFGFEMAAIAADYIADMYNLSMKENDLIYLAIHFQAAIERMKDEGEKTKIIIVCHFGAAAARIIRSKESLLA